jgi:hypothetical protein
MTVSTEELGPAVGRTLFTIFDTIENWFRTERASRDLRTMALFRTPSAIPLISNLVVRKEETGEVVAWFRLQDRGYAFTHEYLVKDTSLASLRASRVRLTLTDATERVLFKGTSPCEDMSSCEVEDFAPGSWIQDFLRLFEAISRKAHEEMSKNMLRIARLGYWQKEQP